jgi:siroheme synthase-like protein
MKTYPIMLSVHDRLAVVVGGGRVGLRRARSLLEAGARVRLVAEEAPDEALPGAVELIRGPYSPEALNGAWIVLACTSDRELNAKIAENARQRGALVNVADQPEDCDFFLPSVVQDGCVVVAVGTGGAAPALAAHLRDNVKLPERIGEFAACLSELRNELKLEAIDRARRMDVMSRLADDTTRQLFRSGGSDAVRKRMRQLLEIAAPPQRDRW